MFHLKWYLYCLKENNFCTINFLVDLFLQLPNIYQLFLKHLCWGMQRTYYKNAIWRSINIIHCYYQWKLLKPTFFYFKIKISIEISRWFSQVIWSIFMEINFCGFSSKPRNLQKLVHSKIHLRVYEGDLLLLEKNKYKFRWIIYLHEKLLTFFLRKLTFFIKIP